MSKNFIHHDFIDIQQINTDNGRLYETPHGNFPSVTTVVGLMTAKYINAWRNRVGNEEANKVSARASKRGTDMHTLCESYLKTGKAEPKMFDVEMFNSFKPHLEKIDNIHAMEQKMFSKQMKVAGTVDTIGEYTDKLSVIDYKSSSKEKTKDQIEHYFVQTTFYALMFWEQTKILPEQMVIIMGVDGLKEALVFQETLSNKWIDKMISARTIFSNRKGY